MSTPRPIIYHILDNYGGNTKAGGIYTFLTTREKWKKSLLQSSNLILVIHIIMLGKAAEAEFQIFPSTFLITLYKKYTFLISPNHPVSPPGSCTTRFQLEDLVAGSVINFAKVPTNLGISY